MDRYKVTDSFSTGRVLNLAKRTVAIQGRGWFTGFAAVIGILTLWWFYPLLNNTQPWHHYQAASLIPTALFLFHLGGYLMTSKIFNELHTPSTAFLSLTLPASTTEKLICAWLITAPLYAFVFLISLVLFLNVIQFATSLFAGTSPSIVWSQIFSSGVFANVGTYLTYHAAFLLGAVMFKSGQFIKTILAMILISLLITFTIGILYLMLLSEGSFSLNIILSEHRLYPFIQVPAALILLVIAWITLKRKQLI